MRASIPCCARDDRRHHLVLSMISASVMMTVMKRTSDRKRQRCLADVTVVQVNRIRFFRRLCLSRLDDSVVFRAFCFDFGTEKATMPRFG